MPRRDAAALHVDDPAVVEVVANGILAPVAMQIRSDSDQRLL